MTITIADWISIGQTIGVPSIVCAAAFFFIYKKEIWSQKERKEYMTRETDADDRMFNLMEGSSDASHKMASALEMLTKSNDHLADSITRMLERRR